MPNRGGGGGSNNKKRSCRREKPKMSFVFFVLFCSLKYVQNRRFCAKFGQKCVLKKEQKRDHDFCLFGSFLFFFFSFCRISFTKCPQTENKKEQKRSCRRDNRKMSFVFFVVGFPPPPPPKKSWGKIRTVFETFNLPRKQEYVGSI